MRMVLLVNVLGRQGEGEIHRCFLHTKQHWFCLLLNILVLMKGFKNRSTPSSLFSRHHFLPSRLLCLVLLLCHHHHLPQKESPFFILTSYFDLGCRFNIIPFPSTHVVWEITTRLFTSWSCIPFSRERSFLIIKVWSDDSLWVEIYETSLSSYLWEK